MTKRGRFPIFRDGRKRNEEFLNKKRTAAKREAKHRLISFLSKNFIQALQTRACTQPTQQLQAMNNQQIYQHYLNYCEQEGWKCIRTRLRKQDDFSYLWERDRRCKGFYAKPLLWPHFKRIWKKISSRVQKKETSIANSEERKQETHNILEDSQESKSTNSGPKNHITKPATTLVNIDKEPRKKWTVPDEIPTKKSVGDSKGSKNEKKRKLASATEATEKNSINSQKMNSHNSEMESTIIVDKKVAPKDVKRRRKDLQYEKQVERGYHYKQFFSKPLVQPLSGIVEGLNIPEDIINPVIHYIVQLLQTPLDAEGGIQTEIHKPLGRNGPEANILRKAALQLYFGKPTKGGKQTVKGYTERYMYGSGSGSTSIGADPRTRKHYPWQKCFDVLKDFLEANIPDLHCKKKKGGFNHVTLVVYFGKEIRPYVEGCDILGKKRDEATVGMHRDAIWSWKRSQAQSKHSATPMKINRGSCSYSNSSNSQAKGTDVVIVSFGHKRTFSLHRHYHLPSSNDRQARMRFGLRNRKKRRKRKKSNQQVNSKANNEDSSTFNYNMDHGTVFHLKGRDEAPRGEHGQFFKHSVIKKGEGISVAMIFRRVKNTALISDETNTVLLTRADKKCLASKVQAGNNKRISKAEQFDEYKRRYEAAFTSDRRQGFNKNVRFWIRKWPIFHLKKTFSAAE